MKRIYEKPIEKYQYNDDYFVEFAIVTTDLETLYEAYLQKKGYGIKMLMFSVPAKNMPLERFKDMMPVNVELNIDLYEKLYAD